MNANSAGTFMMSDGLRVSWSNVSFANINEVDNGYEIEFQWKYKVSIRHEKTFLEKSPGLNIRDFFKRYGLVLLIPGLYINLKKIMVIQEEVQHGPIDYTKLRIVFVDGYELNTKMTSESWSWWRSNHA